MCGMRGWYSLGPEYKYSLNRLINWAQFYVSFDVSHTIEYMNRCRWGPKLPLSISPSRDGYTLASYRHKCAISECIQSQILNLSKATTLFENHKRSNQTEQGLRQVVFIAGQTVCRTCTQDLLHSSFSTLRDLSVTAISEIILKLSLAHCKIM